MVVSYAIGVTAIDTNKVLLDQIKDSNVEVIYGKIEEFNPKEKFDYGLIVWPGFHNYEEIFSYVKDKVLKEGGKLIVIKSKEHDLKRITKKLFPEIFGKQKKFLEVLLDFFEIEKEKIIETEWIYPNFDEALKLMIFELEAFYGKTLIEKQKRIVGEFINEHEKNGKIHMNATLKVLLYNSVIT